MAAACSCRLMDSTLSRSIAWCSRAFAFHSARRHRRRNASRSTADRGDSRRSGGCSREWERRALQLPEGRLEADAAVLSGGGDAVEVEARCASADRRSSVTAYA